MFFSVYLSGDNGFFQEADVQGQMIGARTDDGFSPGTLLYVILLIDLFGHQAVL